MGALLVVLVVNPALAFIAVRILGGRFDASLLVAAALAQIGEFSFILANLGISLNVLSEPVRQLILATSIISILANPLAFALAGWLLPRLRRQPAPAAAPVAAAMQEELSQTSLVDHAV